MNDREQPEMMSIPDTDQPQDGQEATPMPVMDMEVFEQLRDIIRSHYLWRWDESEKATRDVVKDLSTQIRHDPQFRLVGDIELDNDIFEITLWLEETLAFSLASVDMMMLDTLQIDFSRGAVLARELTRLGLEYHLVTFGDGRAQEFHINIIGPRMQQIRDLGTLVAPAMDSYSA